MSDTADGTGTWICVRRYADTEAYEPVAVYDNEREAEAWQNGIDDSEYGQPGYAFCFDENQGRIDIKARIREASE